MNFCAITLTAATVGFLMAIADMPPAEPVPPEKKGAAEQRNVTLRWRSDYNEARKEAERSKRMIVLYFPNPYSNPGVKMELAFTDPKLKAFLHDNSVALRLNPTPKIAKTWLRDF